MQVRRPRTVGYLAPLRYPPQAAGYLDSIEVSGIVLEVFGQDNRHIVLRRLFRNSVGRILWREAFNRIARRADVQSIIRQLALE